MAGNVFSGVRAKWLPLYEALRDMVASAVGAFEERETGSAMLWKHSSTFAEVGARQDAMVVGFASDALHEEWHPVKTVQTSKHRVAHYFEVTDEHTFAVLTERIQAAYALTKTSRPVKREPAGTYTTVDEYIAVFEEQTAELLRAIRATIREAAPEAVEKISWQMPTYHYHENLVHFAAAKNHVGLFPSPEAIQHFSERLTDYTSTKGGIQFPYAKPIPLELIGEITRWRLEQVRQQNEGD